MKKIAIVLLHLLTWLTSERYADAAAAKEIFSKTIDAHHSLKVMQQPLAVASANAVFNTQLLPATDHVYQVSVELHETDSAAIVLGTVLYVETDENPFDFGFAVLDIYLKPRQIILPIVRGPTVELWSIDLFQMGSRWTILLGWGADQAAKRLDPSTIKVDISELPDGRIRASVTELRRNGDQLPPGISEQIDRRQWEFKVTQDALETYNRNSAGLKR